MKYASDILQGLHYIHGLGVIHSDMKLQNALLQRPPPEEEEEYPMVKLCDFGFARLISGPGESCTDYVATRWYWSPELLVQDTKYST